MRCTLGAREEFLYELKAGPAGGRLRRPSSAGRTTRREPGVPTRIAGRPSRLAIRRPGRCANLSADATILASISRASASGNWYQLLACLRGPGLASGERQVHQLLATTTVRG